MPNKYDDLFSLLVREAANWTCVKCGRGFDYNHSGLHASHYCVRNYQATRFDPRNVFAHCSQCHQHFHDNPRDFDIWVETRTDVDRLRRLNRNPWHWRPGEKREMHRHYKSELKRIKDLRMDGDVSVIPIEPYERVE